MTDIFKLLSHCRPFVEPALKYAGDTHTWDDIANGVLNNRFQLWPAEDSAIVTEVIVYPQLKDLHFFLVGGNMDTLKRMRPAIEKWGAENGCTRVSCAGRKGWARSFLKDEGYKETWVVLSKDLNNDV